MTILHTAIEFDYSYGSFFIKEDNLKVIHNQGTLSVIDLSNAHKRGQKCFKASISNKGFMVNGNDYMDFFIKFFKSDFREMLTFFFERVKDVEEERFQMSYSALGHSIEIHTYQLQANKVFSPFAIDRLKPLNKAPDKWTLTHFIKVLANNQFSDFRLDRFEHRDEDTVDKRDIDDSERFEVIQELMTSVGNRHGYWISETDGRLEINCYSFETRSLRLDLNMVPA